MKLSELPDDLAFVDAIIDVLRQKSDAAQKHLEHELQKNVTAARLAENIKKVATVGLDTRVPQVHASLTRVVNEVETMRTALDNAVQNRPASTIASSSPTATVTSTGPPAVPTSTPPPRPTSPPPPVPSQFNSPSVSASENSSDED